MCKEEEEGFPRPVAPDPVFRTVPRDRTTFLIWRIADTGAELLPRSHYGTFYDGDAYLVYSCSLPGQPAGPDVIRREIKENGNGEFAERHIHAWASERGGALGSLALRRGIQLSTHLGSPAVLHRETAANESPRLLSYFRDGMRILCSSSVNGGARLYRVRGRRPMVQQLESVSCSHLVSDGVFILDTAGVVVLWLGRAAHLIEKVFGAKVAYRLARGTDKGMISRRIMIAHDGYEQTLSLNDRSLLDALLELRSRTVRPASALSEAPHPARLYKATQPQRTSPVSIPSQRPAARLEEVKRAPLYREDLSDDGVYIVDGGVRGMWAWAGPRAGSRAAAGAMAAARGLARARRRVAPVAVAAPGREPLEFAALFHGWHWADARRDVRQRAARSATTRLDANSLASNAWLAAEAQLPDDGSGSLRAWRVRREDEGAGPALQEVEHPQQAVFYDHDCYVTLYTYHAPTGDQTILYLWMGGSSPNDLRNLGAKEARDLYIKLGRLPVQAWVYQGKEPAHFLQIFKGRMITYIGSATDYEPSGRRVVAPSRALIRVSGQYAREARGVQVGGAAAAGRGACYVLREGARAWVWCAATATGDEREVAKNLAASDHTLVMQGKEKQDFWNVLGERRRLLITSPLKEVERPLPPRLFYVSLTTPGQYSFEEIISFSQYDLAPEMCAVLDAHSALFVWLGTHCGPRARDDCRLIGQQYLAHDPAVRDPETPILVLGQGREPPNFTGFFPHWKNSMWKGHKTFSAIVSALEGKAIVRGGNIALQNGNSENCFDQHEKYCLSVLRGPKEHLPCDVDPLTKELYLTHDDFVSTFSMPYSEFRALPTWKQKELKKLSGLF